MLVLVHDGRSFFVQVLDGGNNPPLPELRPHLDVHLHQPFPVGGRARDNCSQQCLGLAPTVLLDTVLPFVDALAEEVSDMLGVIGQVGKRLMDPPGINFVRNKKETSNIV